MEKIRIFSTPKERAMGLQFNEPLSKDEVALFIEPEPRNVTFHNKNVNFGIIIKFFNNKGELIKVDHLPKYTSGLRQVSCDNAKYILEKTAFPTVWGKILPKKPPSGRFANLARKLKDEIGLAKSVVADKLINKLPDVVSLPIPGGPNAGPAISHGILALKTLANTSSARDTAAATIRGARNIIDSSPALNKLKNTPIGKGDSIAKKLVIKGGKSARHQARWLLGRGADDPTVAGVAAVSNLALPVVPGITEGYVLARRLGLKKTTNMAADKASTLFKKISLKKNV